MHQSFTINLQTGAATRPRDDVALHLSVRPTEPVIVRNHWENKAWGVEERFGGCPIHPGQPFEILILAESSAFKVRTKKIISPGACVIPLSLRLLIFFVILYYWTFISSDPLISSCSAGQSLSQAFQNTLNHQNRLKNGQDTWTQS